MSRVAKSPVVIPAGIEVSLNGNDITVKGKSASLSTKINSLVKVAVNDGAITFAPVDDSLEANAQSEEGANWREMYKFPETVEESLEFYGFIILLLYNIK